MHFKSFLTIFMGLLLLAPQSGIAGWFGPDDYYDCIEKNLPSATDKYKLFEIKNMCRNKFPPKRIPQHLLKKIQGNALVWSNTSTSFSADFYNGIEDWEIFEIIVKIWSDNNEPIKYALRPKNPIKPLSKGKAACELMETLENWKWNIVEVKGYPCK